MQCINPSECWPWANQCTSLVLTSKQIVCEAHLWTVKTEDFLHPSLPVEGTSKAITLHTLQEQTVTQIATVYHKRLDDHCIQIHVVDFLSGGIDPWMNYHGPSETWICLKT